MSERDSFAEMGLPGTVGHPISVLIADDQSLVRSGFKMLLSSYPFTRVVGEASNGLEVVGMARELTPDVVLMDIRMPVMDGIEATRAIVNDPISKNCHILILTTFDLDEYVYDALIAGASGFLLKDTDPDELVNAIRVIAQGEALLSPSVTRQLVSEFVRSRKAMIPTPSSNLSLLTEREREVLITVAHGLSNQEIADELFISPATAKTHVGRIMMKLDAHDRAQLVVLAYENGLVAPGDTGV
jgi:DNA-binding NarL/FixJ family response regulator